MDDVRQPVAEAHRHVPRPGTYGTVAPAGLHGRARSLHALGIHARAAAATVPASRTCTFSRMDILEWRELGPVVTRELLQHHDSPTTSYLGSELGSRLRHVAPHHSFSW
jgi:hypothetical protein